MVRSFVAPACALLLAALAGCASSSPASTSGGASNDGTAAPAHYPMDDTLKLNQLQALGSHNSYHQLTPKAFRDALDAYLKSHVTQAWEYDHPPLDQQFANQGVRQIELDVHLDPDGRFATRRALPMAQLPAESGIPELAQPGTLKVFHEQEIDFASNCPTFVSCLQTVKKWSDANPGHAPIMILVEAKDDQIPDPLNMNFAKSIPFDKTGLDQIDTEIKSVFADGDLITPDKVRGSHATLEESVLAGGWPTLGASRGKVLFCLDNGGLKTQYADGHKSLQGRVMFSNAEPGEPEAAFVERNEAKDKQAEITDLVKKGYIVRTRSDGDTKEARTNDTSSRDAAIASGAQWVSTDYAVADPAMGTEFKVTIPGGTPARCNPVNAPPACKASDIENPAYLSTR